VPEDSWVLRVRCLWFPTSNCLATWLIPSGTTRSWKYHESTMFWRNFCGNFRMSRGALQKLHRRSRYEKRIKLVFCTQSKKGSENQSSHFEPKIPWISCSRGSGPPLILESRSWIMIESKIDHPRENSCYIWTELNIENGVGSWSRLYQPEAFGPSGPGLVLSTRNNFLFFSFFPQLPSSLPPPSLRERQLFCLEETPPGVHYLQT